MLVSIIVPAYKQERTIQKDILNIHNVMSQTRWKFEIIVVVDGFFDNTLENASKVRLPNVKVVGYRTNKGKGYAVRYGMARSSGDYIAFIDSGMEINANGISLVLEHMEWYQADVIVASKKHLASKVSMPILRRFYSFGYHLIVRLLFGLRIRDTQTGLKVFRRAVLEEVLPRLLIKEYAFDIEVLAVSYYLGYRRIFEAPVEINWDFKSTNFKGFLFMDPFIRKMLIDSLAVFYRLKIQHYYDTGNKRKWIYDKELEMRINTGL